MHRLLEGEERAASITVSMLNCRKHSTNKAIDDGSNPTRAVRAAAFRVVRSGARDRVVAKALSMIEGKTPLSKSIVEASASVEKTQRTNTRSTKVSLLLSRIRARGHYAPEHL